MATTRVRKPAVTPTKAARAATRRARATPAAATDLPSASAETLPSTEVAAAARIADAATECATPPAASAATGSAPARRRPPTRLALMRRVERAIDAELARIETVIADGSRKIAHSEAERRARTLAMLARTLQEVVRLRAEPKGGFKDASKEMNTADDTPMPRDLDEFRRELSRRLDLLVAEAAAAHPEPADRD